MIYIIAKFTAECVIVTASERQYTAKIWQHMAKKQMKSTAVYCSCVIEIKQRTGIYMYNR